MLKLKIGQLMLKLKWIIIIIFNWNHYFLEDFEGAANLLSNFDLSTFWKLFSNKLLPATTNMFRSSFTKVK